MPALAVERGFMQSQSRDFYIARPEAKELPTAEAFLLMKVKRGMNIGCISIPLMRAPTAAQAKEIITGILGTTADDLYVSEQNNLFFQAAPGLYKGLDKLFEVPQRVLGITMDSQKREFERETMHGFFDCVDGTFVNADAKAGKETFPFGYRIENGQVMGLSRKGVKQAMKALAMDEEHTNMLDALDGTLVGGPEELTIVEISRHPTVSLCCAVFFKEKFLEKLYNLPDPIKDVIKNVATLLFGQQYAFNLMKERNETCSKCGGEGEINGHRCVKDSSK